VTVDLSSQHLNRHHLFIPMFRTKHPRGHVAYLLPMYADAYAGFEETVILLLRETS